MEIFSRGLYKKAKMSIYLDHNATTPLDAHSLHVYQTALHALWGNPSSPTQAGQAAKAALRQAREAVARCFAAKANEIVFTSGGSESINWVLRALYAAHGRQKNHFISSPTEHHATLSCLAALQKQGARVTFLTVDRQGRIDLDELDAAIDDTTLSISLMAANNETGLIHPTADIGAIARKRGVFFHCDAVCAVGKLLIDVSCLNVDFLSFSAHKFYGPKGVGGLYIRQGRELNPLISGGKQEFGKRAGTENTPAIAAAADALTRVYADYDTDITRLRRLRDRLTNGLATAIPDISFNSLPSESLANTLNLSIPGIDAESAVIAFDLEGIALSTGAACASGATDPSHVLLAMGRSPDEAKSTLRLSLGRTNTEEEIEEVLEIFPKIIERLRHRSTSK